MYLKRIIFGATVGAALWGETLLATPDLRFEMVWFCCSCSTGNHFCQNEFDLLNIPTPNGHFLAMPTDSQRAAIYGNGNVLAAYYDSLMDGWTAMAGAQKASVIDSYVTANMTSNGPRPDWLVVNEISAGNWPGNASYRAWLREVVDTLTTVYGYTVMLYSPFPNPGANDTDWQAIASEAYIAIEDYLSGASIAANGFSVSWCQSQYQSSINSYGVRGVAKSRLMLGEHFGQTTAGTTWGRSGVSSNDWINAINA
jgi:hypothetical protein